MPASTTEISNALIKSAFVTALDTIWSAVGAVTAVLFLFAKLAEVYTKGWDCLPTEPVTVPYFLEDEESLIYTPQGILGNGIALGTCVSTFIMAFAMNRVSWNMFTFVVDISGTRARPTTGLMHYAEYMIVRFLFVVCIMANLYLHRMHSVPMYTISILYVLRCLHINPLMYLAYEVIAAVFACIYVKTLSKYFKLLPEMDLYKEEDLDLEVSVEDV